jgi:hypothetical protein
LPNCEQDVKKIKHTVLHKPVDSDSTGSHERYKYKYKYSSSITQRNE